MLETGELMWTEHQRIVHEGIVGHKNQDVDKECMQQNANALFKVSYNRVLRHKLTFFTSRTVSDRFWCLVSSTMKGQLLCARKALKNHAQKKKGMFSLNIVDRQHWCVQFV